VLDWLPASGDATLVSWTVAHSRADAAGDTRPTIVAIGELAEGPWWWSRLVAAEPAQLRVGAPLEIRFLRHGPDVEAVPVFALRAAPPAPDARPAERTVPPGG
jgi:uncharacterized protein